MTGPMRAQLADLQIINLQVDLGQPRFTAHACSRCNLHLVFVHELRWRELRPEFWEAVRQMIRKASARRGNLLSRLGLLPDHLHLVLGFGPEESPLEVAVGYMNNIAFARVMQPLLMASCYLGTFGEYDLGCIAPTAWLPR